MTKKQNIGEVFLELEVILDKLVDMGLQRGDILWQIYGHLESHRPDCLEVVERDGSNFIMRYGHKDDLFNLY